MLEKFKVNISINISPATSLTPKSLESYILKTFSQIDPQPYDYEIGGGEKEKTIYFFFILDAENRFAVLKKATNIKNELQRNWKKRVDQNAYLKIEEINTLSPLHYWAEKMRDRAKQIEKNKEEREEKKQKKKNRPLWKKFLDAIW